MKSMMGLAALLVAVGAAGAQGPRDMMKIPVFYSVPGTEAVRGSARWSSGPSGTRC